jgi:1-deoxy-D-xylulose-5-phosphate reductoisomerase
MKRISILGSTGSIGKSTLDICRQHADRFSVVGLAAGQNTKLLLEQIQEFHPRIVSVISQKQADEIRSSLPAGVELVVGAIGAEAVATHEEATLVVSAIVGAAGLSPTLKAIEAKKTIALANKESMVIAGELMSAAARQHGVSILPVDSEHSAIFQCLKSEAIDDVASLILTASGGPFLKRPVQDFIKITKNEALKHPNWRMGEKITIDSATMMNKGLEVMEARWLFGVPVDRIRVVVHPQSIVHSMVEFIDGAILAHLGEPDMRVPIAYALNYPRRISTGVKKLHLPEREQLTFLEPDFEKFGCLKLALEAARLGKSYPAVLNAANEVAVEMFLKEKIRFVDIAKLLEACMGKHQAFAVTSLEDVLEADRWARETMANILKR